MQTKKFEKYSDILKAMSHPVRLQILDLLQKGPSCVTKALENLNVSQPNLSQHLKSLKGAGLIDCKCEGVKRCYYITKPKLVSSVLSLLKKSI